MSIIFLLLGVACLLGGLFCTVIILIDAFQDAIWKGIVALLCCFLYYLYYALFEFEHQNKWAIVLGSLCLNSAGWFLLRLGGVSVPGR